jgi:hypothetical protein
VSRLPVAAFAALAIATAGAFFVVQHLKVTTPLINGFPAPYPSAINPVDGKICLRRNAKGKLAAINFRRMGISFYLQGHADNVNVYILDSELDPIRELPGSGVHMGLKKRHLFIWNGREDDGSIAPDGNYYIRVVLVHQAREVEISNPDTGDADPVAVITRPPRPLVTSVSPSTVVYGSGSAVTIRYSGNEGQRPQIRLYRVTAGGSSRLVKSFAATSVAGHSEWNGEIGGRPAPPGTYLVGLAVIDRACNTGTFPATLPPLPGSAPHAEITVTS